MENEKEKENKITSLKHLFVTVFISGFASVMVIPAITDVTMSAICPGQDECSLAIYLTGIQQAIIGLGTVIMMPLIGNLSDAYGRKAMLTLPMTLSIIPLVIVAYRRDTNYFYAYYVFRTLTAMICEGSVTCLALAYVADNISEGERTAAFGILSGIASASFVGGTFAARFLSPASTFQVATLASMIGAVYMRMFLRESIPDNHNELTQPIILKQGSELLDNQPKKAPLFKKKLPSINDIVSLLKHSTVFSQALVVGFFTGLTDGGVQASLLYYLKASFHFNKNQFADLMLIASLAGVVSQLVLVPMLAHIIREEWLLSIGLLTSCICMILYSIAWSGWVPYAISVLAIFVMFITPALRSIASKQIGPNDQGKAQGCMSGITSLANIISPLIFSPLTALFLSEEAPFHYPGFSFLCLGLTSMIAFIQSLMIKSVPCASSHKVCSNDDEV